MNKTIIALSLALAASTGAFTQAYAEDGFQMTSANGQANFAAGVIGNQAGENGGIDYTATASIGGSEAQMKHDDANRSLLFSF